MSDYHYQKGDLVRIKKTRIDYLDGKTAIVLDHRVMRRNSETNLIKLRLVEPAITGIPDLSDRYTAFVFPFQLELLAKVPNEV